MLNNPLPSLTHPRVLSIRGADTPRPNGTPNLSPIEPNRENGFSTNKSENGSDKVNKQRWERGGKRKDSYTNRSRVMESTRVERDTQPQVRDRAEVSMTSSKSYVIENYLEITRLLSYLFWIHHILEFVITICQFLHADFIYRNPSP